MHDLFEMFWSAYPRRVAKGAARLAFARAIRKTTIETMLSALESYKKHKPDYCDWAHPSTWLNQERWADEWEPPPTIKPEPIFRPANSLDEVRKYFATKAQASPTLTKQIKDAKSLEDIPAFARLIPTAWNAH